MCCVKGSKFSCGVQEFFVLVRISEEYPAAFLSTPIFHLLSMKDGPDPLTTSRVTIKLPNKIKKKFNYTRRKYCMANLQPNCLVLLPLIPSPSK